MLPTPAIPDWSSRKDFSGAFLAGRDLPQSRRRELGRERLDPEPGEALRQLRVVDQEGLAETPRVGEPDLAAVVEEEAGTQVALLGGALALVEDAALGGVEDLPVVLPQHQVAGHPQVHDQRLVAVEAEQQVLPPSSQPLDRAPFDLLAELLRRHRPRPAGIEHLEPLDRVAFQLRLELAGDGLDLGQLRHAGVLPLTPPWPAGGRRNRPV